MTVEKEVTLSPSECAVCGLSLRGRKTIQSQEFRGEIYSLCSSKCFKEFLENPEAFMREEEEEEDQS